MHLSLFYFTQYTCMRIFKKHSYVIFIISFKDMKENATQFYRCILQEGVTVGML